MLERPGVLAAALREACGPFARRDVAAMVAAGDIGADTLGRATRYWEWLLIGALVDGATNPRESRRIEESLVELVLRLLGFGPKRVTMLIERLASSPTAAAQTTRTASATRAKGAAKS
jgi:hypothetical protein